MRTMGDQKNTAADPRIAQLRKVLEEAGYFVNDIIGPSKFRSMEGRRYKMQVAKKGEGEYIGKLLGTDRGRIEKLVKSVIPEARLFSRFADYSVTYVWFCAEPTPSEQGKVVREDEERSDPVMKEDSRIAYEEKLRNLVIQSIEEFPELVDDLERISTKIVQEVLVNTEVMKMKAQGLTPKFSKSKFFGPGRGRA